MLARKAITLIGASALTAAVAGAQQPAKQPSTSHPSSQAPAQAKKTGKTSTATALPVSTDSAKKIVVAHAAGATVSSAKLHHSEGKAYYAVSYKMKGSSKTMHGTVDANTGVFTASPSSSAPSNGSAKKPS